MLQTSDPTALYLLSAPSCPEEATQEAIELAEKGERITAKLAKEIIKSHSPEADIDVPVCDGDADDDDYTNEWCLGDCVMSLHGEVQRWRMKCPKSEITELIQAIRDIADQLETRHVK